MNIVVVTPPPFEPVSAAEVFTHLRLDVGPSEALSDHPDYAFVMALVKSARETAEQVTRRAFIKQTLRLITGASSGLHGRWLASCGSSIELPKPPVVSVSSVSYYDEDNVLQTVDSGDYFVTGDFVASIQFVDDYLAPEVYDRRDAIRIEYVAGYAPTVASPSTQDEYAGNVPEGIKQAILIGAQLLYDELTPDKRESLERTRDALLASHRVHTF